MSYQTAAKGELMSLGKLCEAKLIELITHEEKYTKATIREDLIVALDYFEAALPITKKNFLAKFFFVSLGSRLHWFLIDKANGKEIRYTLSRMRQWYQSNAILGDKDLVRLSLPHLSQDEFDKTDDAVLHAMLVIGSRHLLDYLNRPIVLKTCFRMIEEGNMVLALKLAEYYYDQQQYRKAFDLLQKVKEPLLEIDKSRLLGLLYYYGRGVAQDYQKARPYLERYNDNAVCNDLEVINALGIIYEQTIGLKKAFSLYQTILDCPYSQNSPFYRKIQQRFKEYHWMCTLHDRIRLKVKITPQNKKCEFSIELPSDCCALINWGDSGTKRKSTGISEHHRKIALKHTYKHAGIYEITIEATCAKSIEAFEFVKYKHQLIEVEFERCRGIKKITIIGQQLTELYIPQSYFLIGLICRNNHIKTLNLQGCPALNHLDCSYNPLTEILVSKNIAITNVCLRGTRIDKDLISKITNPNNGTCCNQLSYESLEKVDMRLEYYFRCTTWQKTQKYMKDKSSSYYWHHLSECEIAFNRLKELSETRNHTPYKHGYLAVHDEYVSDDTILYEEEFFIEEQAWTICLATKVRDARHREPWMMYKPTTPEYYVGNCLVNMISNKTEMSAIKATLHR